MKNYEDFIDGISKSLNSQWAPNMSPENVSRTIDMF